MIAFTGRLFEFETPPPHEEQSDHVAEIHTARLALTFQALKAIDQQIVIHAQAAAFTFGRHDARPEAEGIRWRSLPSFAAVVLPDESAIPFDEDRVDALPRPQFPARGGAAAGVCLNFVVRHAR